MAKYIKKHIKTKSKNTESTGTPNISVKIKIATKPNKKYTSNSKSVFAVIAGKICRISAQIISTSNSSPLHFL